MPVVINEFEVVPDNPPPTKTGVKPADESDAPKKGEKPDLEKILRHWRERAERVRAH